MPFADSALTFCDKHRLRHHSEAKAQLEAAWLRRQLGHQVRECMNAALYSVECSPGKTHRSSSAHTMALPAPAIATSDGARPHLLKLPREIRDTVLHHALVTTQGVIECQRTMWQDGATSEMKALGFDIARPFVYAYMALSATCRQLNNEARTAFFSGNNFCAWIAEEGDDPALCDMDAVLQYIKHIVVYCYDAHFNGNGHDMRDTYPS